MKVQFHCNNCLESFHIGDQYLVKKESIICPNCDSHFPQESFLMLQQASSLLIDCRDKMEYEHTSAGYTTKFNFKIID